MTKKCSFILESGRQCGAYALTNKDYCFSHDPESREKKALAVRKGGLAKAVIIPEVLEDIKVDTPDDVIILLGKTLKEVRAGRLPSQTANTIGFLSGHLIRAFEVARMNDKIEEVRAALEIRKPPKRSK